ncbi:unnamed protein product [Malus baccata var. baccata]
MLILSSFPSSIEATIFCVSNHGFHNGLCDWMPGAETWQMCTKCDDHCSCRRAQLISEENKNFDDSRSLNFLRSSSQLSAVTMSESSAPNLVYKRRKLQGNRVTVFPGERENTISGDFFSFLNSEASTVAAKEGLVSQLHHETEATRAHSVAPCLCKRVNHVLNSEYCNGCSAGEELVSDEAPKNNMQKLLEVSSVNDSCSSSKSNMEHVSTSAKTEVDETGECSSSSAIVMEAVGDLSEKDLCISILRSHGLLGDSQATMIGGSAEDTDTISGEIHRRSCNICSRSGTTLKMLICDHCEEAFHMSCCHSRMKKPPIDEWFCHSCLKKKHKILQEKVTKTSPNITSVMSREASSKGQMNPIMLMLRDIEPYTTSVRVGKGFQAEVPDWSGPTNGDISGNGEPLELDSSEYARLHGLNCNKPSRHSSIGNWLQCREVVDRANGTICGKWRRAPLFEVQTNDWECFCSILWDPSHADCNVPQELETDQVLKQLKYIETLRPRLSAKQHTLEGTKSAGDLKNRIVGWSSNGYEKKANDSSSPTFDGTSCLLVPFDFMLVLLDIRAAPVRIGK